MTMLLSVLMSLTISAQAEVPVRDSFTCPGTQLQEGESIVCCDTREGKSCKETQDALLTVRQKETLARITQEVLNKPDDNNMIVQNCFRTALEVAGVTPVEPQKSLNPGPFFKSLELEYRELPEGMELKDLEPQDVLVFEEKGRYMGWDEYEHTSGKYSYWFESGSTNHALVYLGDGLIIQKENTFTAVSSIATRDRAFATYEEAAVDAIDKALYTKKEITFYMRVFRKKATLP